MPHDRPQGSVGFHRRAVDADPLALHQTALGNERHEPSRKPFRGPRAALARDVSSTASAMIGNLVALLDQDAGTSRSGHSNPNVRQQMPRSLSDTLEDSRPCSCGISELAAMTAHFSSSAIVRLALILDKSVEAGLFQQCLQPVVEGVSRRTRHLSPGRNDVVLNHGLAAHRHRTNSITISMVR